MITEWWIYSGLGGGVDGVIADTHEESRPLTGQAGDCSGAVL